MAKAPRPGAGRRAEQMEEAKKILRITLLGEARTLAVRNIPLGEKILVRNVLNKPYEDFLNPIGEDTYSVWWWLARRANGERNLTFAEVAAEWPVNLDISAKSKEIQLEMVGPEEDAANSPEA